MATTTTINGVTFHRGVANADYYGNERLIVHFSDFLTEKENQELEILEGWALACKRGKKIGWRNYRGNNFGGGLVCQYCATLEQLANEINELKAEDSKPKGYAVIKKR